MKAVGGQEDARAEHDEERRQIKKQHAARRRGEGEALIDQMNSTPNKTPAMSPVASVPSRANSGCPRALAQAATISVAPAERMAPCSSGGMSWIASLTDDLVEAPGQAQHHHHRQRNGIERAGVMVVDGGGGRGHGIPGSGERSSSSALRRTRPCASSSYVRAREAVSLCPLAASCRMRRSRWSSHGRREITPLCNARRCRRFRSPASSGVKPAAREADLMVAATAADAASPTAPHFSQIRNTTGSPLA